MSRWPMVKLGEVCEVSKDRCNPEELDGVDVNYIGLENLKAGGGLVSLASSRDENLQSQKNRFSKGQILFGKLRPNLKKAYVAQEDGICSTDILCLTCNDRADVKYLAPVLLSDFSTSQILKLVVGINLPRINQKDLLEIQIPLPPLNEQKRIAEILGGVAKAVYSLQEQVDWVERALKSNLQDGRWETQEVLLSDFVSRISTGKSMPDGDMKKPNYQVLKTSAVTSGFFKEIEAKGLPREYIPPLAHKVHAGDILVSRMNTTELVGASAIVESVSENIYLPDRLWKLHLVEGTDPFFLWQLLQTRLIRARISQVSSGSSGSMKNISQKAFLNIKVPFASSSEQSKISKTVRSLLHLRQLLHQKLTLLQELQRSLSARAFAGRL